MKNEVKYAKQSIDEEDIKMHISRYLLRILASALVTGVIAIDAFEIGRISSDREPLQEAGRLKIECFRTIYDSDGNFMGCIKVPCKQSNCLKVTFLSTDVTVSSEGINLH